MARTLPLLLVGSGLALGTLVVLSRRPAPLGAPQSTTPPSSPPAGAGAGSSAQGRDPLGRLVDLGLDITRDLTKVLLNKGPGAQDPGAQDPPPPPPEPPMSADEDLLESRGAKREQGDGTDIVVD